MNNDISEIQKLILLYIGVTIKSERKEFLTEENIKEGMLKELNESIDRKSINSMIKKNIIEDNNNKIKVTDKGKEIARKLLDKIKEKYHDVDWKIIKKFFKECDTETPKKKTEQKVTLSKWEKEYQNFPEKIQDNISKLAENIKFKKSITQLTKEFIEIFNTNTQVRKIIDDEFKYNTSLAILSNRYTPKEIHIEEILHKEQLEPDEQKRIERIARSNFRSQNLIFMLKREFDKDHVGDSKGKLAGFLVVCSGNLPPKYRLSMAIRGDSSVGKTNLMRTALRHLPKFWYAYGTRFTRASLEDDIIQFKIIAFSEKTTDDLTVIESLKQISEDGLQIWKHDKDSNKLKDVNFIERKATLYSSTEKETDEELATRYIVYTVTRHPYKINKVIENIKENYSDSDKLFSEDDRDKKPTWITVGLQLLEDFDKIVIPYSRFICFSDIYPRCQRDAKRFLNLVAVCAWINQNNRLWYEKDKKRVLVADVDDFFWVAFLTNDIFKQTLTNIDKDIDILIVKYKEMIENKNFVILKDSTIEKSPLGKKQLIWVRRSDLQKELDISLNTLKKRCNVLKEKGVLFEHYENRGNRAYIAFDMRPFNMYLIKYDFEKMYYLIKNIENEYLNSIKIKFKGKNPSVRNSIAYKNCKYKPKLSIGLDTKGKINIKSKTVDKDVREMVRYINDNIIEKKEIDTDYNIDEFFDESDVDWNV